MGPLQYMVVGYERSSFRDEILPELRRLKRKGVLRIFDIVFISRDAQGVVTSQELSKRIPEQADLLQSPQENTWECFSQDDIDLAGHLLPQGSAVALILFEHLWAARLDEAISHANDRRTPHGVPLQSLVLEIEHALTMGTEVAAVP